MKVWGGKHTHPPVLHDPVPVQYLTLLSHQASFLSTAHAFAGVRDVLIVKLIFQIWNDTRFSGGYTFQACVPTRTKLCVHSVRVLLFLQCYSVSVDLDFQKNHINHPTMLQINIYWVCPRSFTINRHKSLRKWREIQQGHSLLTITIFNVCHFISVSKLCYFIHYEAISVCTDVTGENTLNGLNFVFK